MKSFVIIAFLMVNCFVFAQNPVTTTRPIQLALPGEPGYIDFNHFKLNIGDSVWVMPIYNYQFGHCFDRNNFVFPHQFKKCLRGKVTFIYAGEFGWEYEVKIHTETEKIQCIGGRPQQYLVFGLK